MSHHAESGRRARVIQRALRLIDGGASVEFALFDVYTLAHIDGGRDAGFNPQPAEVTDLVSAATMLTDYQVAVIEAHVSEEFAKLVDGVHPQGAHNEVFRGPSGAPVCHLVPYNEETAEDTIPVEFEP